MNFNQELNGAGEFKKPEQSFKRSSINLIVGVGAGSIGLAATLGVIKNHLRRGGFLRVSLADPKGVEPLTF
ncbi:MAG: hypothetical protein RLZZ46_580 [Bacteroidota bacterium]